MYSNSYFFSLTRIIFGLFFTLSGFYHAIMYGSYLQIMHNYLDRVTLINIDILEIWGVLIPFQEFLLGSFLIFGFYTKKVLSVAIILFSFLSVLSIDMGTFEILYLQLFYIAIALLLLRREGKKSSNYYSNTLEDLLYI